MAKQDAGPHGSTQMSDDEFNKAAKEIDELGLEEAIGRKIEESEGEEQLNIAHYFIDLGFGPIVAKNIQRFSRTGEG